MPDKRDCLFKILILGESGVGKSCLLLRYADDSFSDSFVTTVGVDFRFRTLCMDDQTIKLQIWDTAGQEKFRTITQAYYANCHGIALVYDVTDRGSFGSVEHWLAEIKARAPEHVAVILVGNKADAAEMCDKNTDTADIRNNAAEMCNKADTAEICNAIHSSDHSTRQVSTAEGKALAKQHQIPFLETSAKDGVNVDAVFFTLVQDLARRGVAGTPGNGMATVPRALQPNKPSCCR